MNAQAQDVFDLLGSRQAKPGIAPKPAGDVFDSVEVKPAPLPAPAPAVAIAAAEPAPLPERYISAARPPTNIFRSPAGASAEAMREQFKASREALAAPGAAFIPVGSAFIPANVPLGLAGMATAPIAGPLRLLENVSRTVALEAVARSAPDVYESLVRRGVIKPALTQTPENLERIGVVTGPERPTTGNDVFDLLADVAAGAVPIPVIPVARIARILRVGREAEPAIKSIGAELVAKGVPNEAEVLAAEIRNMPREAIEARPPAPVAPAPAVTTPARPVVEAPPPVRPPIAEPAPPVAAAPPAPVEAPAPIPPRTAPEGLPRPAEPAPTYQVERPVAIEPEVKPLVTDAVEMRIREINEELSPEVTSLTGKLIRDEATGQVIGRHPGVLPRIPELKGITKPVRKRGTDIVAQKPATPADVRAAIKKDTDDPLYLDIKRRVEEGVYERYGDDIQAANEAAVERRAIVAEAGGEVSFEPADMFDQVAPERPMTVEEFAQQAAQAQQRQRELAYQEVAQQVISAPEGAISKRELLGITKPAARRGETPLFPEEQQRALFGSVGGRVSAKLPPPAKAAAPRPLPAPKPTAAPEGSVLAEAERVTQAEPPRPSLVQRALERARMAPKRIQTSLISEFTPLRELERQVYATAEKPVPVVDLARKFEQVAGAPAKAQADVIQFRRAVIDPVRDYADDFNSYLFLKRTEDRLLRNPEVKRVGDWTVEKARQGLAELRTKIGDEAMGRFEATGRVYQEEMNRALRLQVESGRMSQALYDRIVSGSDFYAPFKVLKYMEDLDAAPSGTGRGIATTEDLTEAITGIGEEDLRLGSILQASAEQIVRSRILAEKNLKMLELDRLADVDRMGQLVKRAQPTRFFPIEYRPAQQILKQLRFQETAQHPQPLEQSFIKVGKALQFAEEVGLKVRQRNLPVSLGRSTIGGVEAGGNVSLNAFTSEVIAHELGHSFDVTIGSKLRTVFGVKRDVDVRLSSAINEQRIFQKELASLVDYTGLGGSPKYRASAKERFAEFLQLYIHDPAKARQLAPTWTDHFETKILPQQKVKNLVERLAAFYQKVDKLPNIATPLKELDDANYLELAIRRAFPDKPTQIGVRFGTKPAPGNDIVVYLKDGKKTALEVSRDVASAIEGLNAAQTGLVSKALALTRVPLQWGATSANAAFQVVNLLFADLPRAALISRYGLRSLRDVYQFPLDWAYSLYTSMRGNFGSENRLFMDWLRSGAANSTIQRELTPSAFRATLGLTRPADAFRFLRVAKETTLDNVAKFANAIEETSKILGLKRGMQLERIAQLSPRAAAEKMQEIAAEVRNYSGSPDFLRKGRDTRSLNLLFMFFNARVQGAASDLARLAGKTGTREAGAAWARLGAAVGVPATILAVVNQSEDFREDYYKIPEWERKNYFMIPRDSWFVTDTGDAVREYWRVPKREVVSLFGNLIESAVEFGRKHDPASFAAFSADALETLSPLNIQGKTPLERLESVVGSTNPLIKAPVELATGRDVFRHYNIIPEYMEGAPTEEQYRHTTPRPYVLAGQSRLAKSLGLSPLHLEQLTRSVTAGGLTQFAPGRPEVGRSWATTFPITKRFVRSGAVEAGEQEEALRAAEEKETAAQVRRRREALDILRDWNQQNVTPMARRAVINQIRRTDPKLAEKLSELQNAERLGITSLDRQVLALGVESRARAEYIRSVLGGLKTEAERGAYLADLRRKKILTAKVEYQLRLPPLRRRQAQ